MFNHNHYVPVLKCKQSELLALGEVTPARQAHMTPLLEIQTDNDPDKLLRSIKKNWNLELPLFIDVDSRFLAQDVQKATNDVGDVTLSLQQDGASPIAVTGLTRNPIYQDTARMLAKATGTFCIRLTNPDFGNPKLSSEVTELVRQSSLAYDKIHLVIDFGAFLPSQIGAIVSSAANVFSALPYLKRWQSLTVIGTAFPSSLGHFTPATPGLTPRCEWLVWESIVRLPTIGRLPAFGDYTVVYPDMPLIDFEKISIAAKIKYTTAIDWLILRWHHGRQYSWDGFYDLCEILVGQPQYSGPDFSWADNQIALCSNRSCSPGNPAKWVRIGVNHHLSFVTDQVSSYSLPSGIGTQAP